ncbi:hypothetical protein BBJ28_00010604 [Nothophytophthora sp. Chile5]|nr:hypothetical protein BBJ28_00010604 [Nothophytophthora sp. Chile5]
MATDDSAQKRLLGWGWLFGREPNGVLAALGSLQPPKRSAAAGDDARLPPPELPLAIRLVLLVMELSLVSGTAFLLLLSASVVGALAQSVLHWTVALTSGQTSDSELSLDLASVITKVCESATFCWGLVEFMSWFFRHPKRVLTQRLLGFSWRNTTAPVVSLLLHLVAIAILAFWQEQRQTDIMMVSWRNVRSVALHPDGSLAAVDLLQSLLFAPVMEELFFRGTIVLVTLNRLQNVKWSAAVSSFLFAAIHLVNLRHLGTHYSASYLAFQTGWSLLVGVFLSLRLVNSGSLSECVVLHMINNVFATSVSKKFAVDLTHLFVASSVLASVCIYAIAIVRQLRQLQQRDSEANHH